MACYHPNYGVWYYDEDEGKRKLRFYPGNAVSGAALTANEKDIVQLPCGHCIGCRSAQSWEWSNRLLMESLYHDTCYFITLTYCDEYRPYVYGTDTSTGEAFVYMPNLEKEHAQNFIKRLRYYHPGDRIRYYIAGEYGDATGLCHFHAVLFGLHLNSQLIECGRSETGNVYYRSPDIEQSWIDTEDNGRNIEAVRQGLDPNLLGFCSCEPANYYTFRYVSAYVTKKLGERPDQEYILRGQTPPFSLSSRNPGIGYQYFKDHPECIEEGQIVLPGPDGAITFPPPRYFKKKMAAIDPGLIDDLSAANMKRANEITLSKMKDKKVLFNELLRIEEDSRLSKLKARDKI